MASESTEDICRVCRSEATPDRTLFSPCICTGSIKYIHQDCLLLWLKHSRKKHCELCKHKFSFMPIYSADMPTRLPIKDLASGLFTSLMVALKYWFHYTLVTFAWLGVVPLTASRVYRCLFTGSINALLTLPLDILSTENLVTDCTQGCIVVVISMCTFISLVWLREQIVHGGGPQWLEEAPEEEQAAEVQDDLDNLPQQNQPADGEQEDVGGGEGEGGADMAHPEIDIEEVADQMAEEDADQMAEEDNPIDEGNPEEAGQGQEQDHMDELTWERMLGLDGSLIFLEHVFWVISLNSLFIFIFAFCPYHFGRLVLLTSLDLGEVLESTYFEGLLTTLAGYIILAFWLILFYTLLTLIRFKRWKKIIGLSYIVLKVFLLVVVEIGLFPLVCGWWLDICSMNLFEVTLTHRINSFKMAPVTAMFLHWLVGMVYVFYFASFILLLREILRPGVLWFLRNLNDPDFNPINEMIHLPVYRHLRRFVLSIIVFGSVVLLMVWIPIQVIKVALPTFLPYNVMFSSNAPVSELSLELLVLQVVVPALLEQGHTKHFLKKMTTLWCFWVSYSLGLKSYLLGDDEAKGGQEEGEGGPEPAANQDDHDQVGEEEGDEEEEVAPGNQAEAGGGGGLPPLLNVGGQPVGGGVALNVVHNALLNVGLPTEFKPYVRPNYFAFKLVLLVVFIGCTLFTFSLFLLIVPVAIGRTFMYLWLGDTKVHELYTAACGTYSLWLLFRLCSIIQKWLPQGFYYIQKRLLELLIMGFNATVSTVLLIGVIPMLLGLIFEVFIVTPIRVPVDQTPLFFLWQDWALGVLHTKIICAITMMGPNWWLKTALEQLYRDGLKNMNLKLVVVGICLPTICILLLILCVPYVISVGLIPLFGLGFDFDNYVYRRIYPFLLFMLLMCRVLMFQVKQFKRLYQHIKNDKYLVGQRLVNYSR